jgi:4'-phosphopantetheinyl transferase
VTVRVWTVDLDQPRAVVDILRAFLDDTEVFAAADRRDDMMRDRYVVAHGATRSILGERLGVAPESVVLSRRCRRCGDPSHGKPEVVGPAGGGEHVAFSVSHSHALAAVAVVADARVGIDIEVERPRVRLDALAARVLDSEAYADWLEVDPAAQLGAFLEQWTAKEAYLKAIGSGITVPLRDVPVDPDGWTITGFPCPPGVIARVAVDRDAVTQRMSWSPPTVGPSRPREPNRPIDKFRGTAVGSVLAAGLLGLRDALEPAHDEEVAIVQDYSGDPPFTDPIVLRLDPDHPEDSIVMVRPWLRNPPAPDPD